MITPLSARMSASAKRSDTRPICWRHTTRTAHSKKRGHTADKLSRERAVAVSDAEVIVQLGRETTQLVVRRRHHRLAGSPREATTTKGEKDVFKRPRRHTSFAHPEKPSSRESPAAIRTLGSAQQYPRGRSVGPNKGMGTAVTHPSRFARRWGGSAMPSKPRTPLAGRQPVACVSTA